MRRSAPTFADGEGRLPRTLEDFLGDSGKLQRLTGALFDPNRRDSAIGQFNEMLGKYFDGDGSRLAQLLDPTREASPLLPVPQRGQRGVPFPRGADRGPRSRQPSTGR